MRFLTTPTLLIALTVLACASSVQTTRTEKLADLFSQGLLASSSIDQANKYFGGHSEILKKDICPDSLFVAILDDLPDKYPYEVHHVTTEDNYILRLFRIQAKNTQIASGKKVVFLQHGLIDSADDWILNTQEWSLGLRLADEGYDVWLGNNRGNKYSLDTSVEMKKKDYWKFSFQQMARYDVPANIKYVLSQTGKETLSYIGHSQGTSQMFAALSDEHTMEYVNSKVNLFIALAPIVYLANQESEILKILAYGTIGIETLADTFGVYSIFPGACSETSAQSEFESALCKIAKPFCNGILAIADANPEYDNTKRLPYFMKHEPSGSSLMQFYHYKQWVKESDKHPEFKMYNYGHKENEKIYGQKTPPVWNLGNIKTKVRAYVGRQDKLGDIKDNSLLASKLNELGVDATFKWYQDCGHMTFMWGLPETAGLIIDDVIEDLKTVNSD